MIRESRPLEKGGTGRSMEVECRKDERENRREYLSYYLYSQSRAQAGRVHGPDPDLPHGLCHPFTLGPNSPESLFSLSTLAVLSRPHYALYQQPHCVVARDPARCCPFPFQSIRQQGVQESRPASESETGKNSEPPFQHCAKYAWRTFQVTMQHNASHPATK